MYLTKLLTLTLALFVGALTALAGTIQLAPFATVDGGVGSGSIYGLAIDGTNAYVQLSLNTFVQIVRIADIGGANIRTSLVSPAQWTAASGKTALTGFQGFDLCSPEYIQFADLNSKAIWRVNKTTGLLINYCDTATITAASGGATLGAVNCVNPANGEHVFWESVGCNILTTAGSNVCNVVVGKYALTNWITGLNGIPAGGMSFDNSGNLYIGTANGLYKRDSGGTISLVYTKTVLQNISLIFSGSSFGTMHMGPSGKFYFNHGTGTARPILCFDPSNPSTTLGVFASSNDLITSVAGSANDSCIRPYGTSPNDGMAWIVAQASTAYGVYFTTLPEPALVGLLGLAALFFRRFV
ncbi:MAG: hypothetical protein NTV22_00435 [bacterium]|nr:hypothetical protein [bacterium]